MALVAVVQMNSGADKAANLSAAAESVKRAASMGARLVALPENFAWMGPETDRPAAAEPLQGPTFERVADWAKAYRVWILMGSILERPAQVSDGRLHNTSVLVSPDGRQAAAYRKIHLFDVEIGDGATYRESAVVAPGTDVVVADTEPGIGRVGLSVCYDLRFPELYRRCAAEGAAVITVPAAFTLMTGKDHWEVLLRARAIENQCWVLAPAQWGRHGEKRVTYGNALIVDPWGAVVARASEGVGMAVAEIDPAYQAKVRRELPALQHRRL